ncbi:MAG: tRNA epoxyqueuosine(34) reductase QueG, partial [Acidobacteria bacterium RIFCSPLOWO2_02_FULL_61_28]
MGIPVAKTSLDLKAWIRDAAERLGFDLCGIAPASLPAHDREQYLWWLQEGFHGEMKYMERRERQDLRLLLPSVRSVICAAMVYNSPHPLSIECHDAGRGQDADRGWISRYAWGDDYHLVLQERLQRLLDELQAAVGSPFEAKIYVDTGPVLERALAQAAGLGWIAKNTCLIHPKAGSWFLVGEILTSLELEPDQPVPDLCGTCTRCIDACPTGAIVKPYVLDATRCISYFTIELKGSIPEEFRPAMGRHVFGCDICQDVCPWNRKAPVTQLLAFQPRSFRSAESPNPSRARERADSQGTGNREQGTDPSRAREQADTQGTGNREQGTDPSRPSTSLRAVSQSNGDREGAGQNDAHPQAPLPTAFNPPL